MHELTGNQSKKTRQKLYPFITISPPKLRTEAIGLIKNYTVGPITPCMWVTVELLPLKQIKQKSVQLLK